MKLTAKQTELLNTVKAHGGNDVAIVAGINAATKTINSLILKKIVSAKKVYGEFSVTYKLTII